MKSKGNDSTGEDKDLRQLIEAIARSSKRIKQHRRRATDHKKATSQQEIVLRLLKIQEHIVTMTFDQKTTEDLARLLDKITLLLEQ